MAASAKRRYPQPAAVTALASTTLATTRSPTLYPQNAALQAIRRFSTRPPFSEFLVRFIRKTPYSLFFCSRSALSMLINYSVKFVKLVVYSTVVIVLKYYAMLRNVNME